MVGRVLVTLLETVVLLDVVQVVLTDDDGVLHLGGLDRASDQLATDVHVACATESIAGSGAARAWRMEAGGALHRARVARVPRPTRSGTAAERNATGRVTPHAA